LTKLTAKSLLIKNQQNSLNTLVQVFINSSYSVRQTLFYVLFTAQFWTASIYH